MSDQDPQQAVPGNVPGGDVTPQPSAAVPTSPDSMRLPPNPLAQPRQGAEDWEARYKGLDRRYQEDRQEWEQQRTAFQQQMADFTAKMQTWEQQLKQPQAKPAPAPVSDGNQEAPQQTTKDSGDLQKRLDELQAERYRDTLLFQMMQPGQPGHDLPLAMFRDNIPVHAPQVGEDGKLDDSKQRAAIENFIKGLRGVAGNSAQQTQQAMTQGWTPGSSPGVPAPQSREALEAEYYRVKEEYGNLPADVSPEREAAVKARYYQLHEQVGRNLPGNTQPWMSGEELLRRVQQLEGTVGQFGNMLKR